MCKNYLFRMKNVAYTVFSVVACFTITGCGANHNVTSTEENQSTITDVTESAVDTQNVSVTLTDSNGNNTVVNGIAVLNEDGTATVTVTDQDNNEMIIQGKATYDDNGKLQLTDLIVIYGDTIKDNDGNEISIVDALVSEIAENTEATNTIDDTSKESQNNEDQSEQNANVDSESLNDSIVASDTTSNNSSDLSETATETNDDDISTDDEEETESQEIETGDGDDSASEKYVVSSSYEYDTSSFDAAFNDYLSGAITREQGVQAMLGIRATCITTYNDGTTETETGYVGTADLGCITIEENSTDDLYSLIGYSDSSSANVRTYNISVNGIKYMYWAYINR